MLFLSLTSFFCEWKYKFSSMSLFFFSCFCTGRRGWVTDESIFIVVLLIWCFCNDLNAWAWRRSGEGMKEKFFYVFCSARFIFWRSDWKLINNFCWFSLYSTLRVLAKKKPLFRTKKKRSRKFLKLKARM